MRKPHLILVLYLCKLKACLICASGWKLEAGKNLFPNRNPTLQR